MLRVCFFGISNLEYSRNRILLRGLKENGCQVIICNSRLTGVFKYFDLAKKHREIKNGYDVMIVGFPGHRIMGLARLLTRKPIIFDAFISLYDTEISDRKRQKPNSLRALCYWILDWLSCQLADEILLDTDAHIDYFVKRFSLNVHKFQRVFVGADDQVIYPRQTAIKNRDKFFVHFHGTFIPLQGVEYILHAAKILEKNGVHFNITGTGQTYPEMRSLARTLQLSNVTFIDFVPYERLAEVMNEADICLGIFGNTNKASRVIPNKVYEALAARCACITGDSEAIRELFVDRKHVLLCKLADSQDLAKKILELKKTPELRNHIADQGYHLFQKTLRPQPITEKLCIDIQNLSS